MFVGWAVNWGMTQWHNHNIILGWSYLPELVPPNNTLFAGTVPANNTLFAGTANKKFDFSFFSLLEGQEGGHKGRPSLKLFNLDYTELKAKPILFLSLSMNFHKPKCIWTNGKKPSITLRNMICLNTCVRILFEHILLMKKPTHQCKLGEDV